MTRPTDLTRSVHHGGMRNGMMAAGVALGVALLVWAPFTDGRDLGILVMFGCSFVAAGLSGLLLMARRRVVVDVDGIEVRQVRLGKTGRVSWHDLSTIDLVLPYRSGWCLHFSSRFDQPLLLQVENFPAREALESIGAWLERQRPDLHPHVAGLVSQLPSSPSPSAPERWIARHAVWLPWVIGAAWLGLVVWLFLQA